jgi:TPR repeat protein
LSEIPAGNVNSGTIPKKLFRLSANVEIDKKVNEELIRDNLTLLEKTDISNLISILGCVYYNLGNTYDLGHGVEQDKEEAVKWWRKAADKGDTDAMVRLGNAYDHGNGVEQDKEEAIKWWRKAADKDDAEAPNVR